MRRSGAGGGAPGNGAVVEWELRPGGMLVQKRDGGGGRDGGQQLITLLVSHGTSHCEISVPPHSTFGELKMALVKETGLQPHEQRLLFKGKEKDDNEYLHLMGVSNMSKIILLEDPASKERRLEKLKSNQDVSKASEAVASVRLELDMLETKAFAIESKVHEVIKLEEKEFNVITELLMLQLLKLDSIEAEGEAKIQRRNEVRRVQRLVETLDSLKAINSSPFIGSRNTVSVTTHWETFESGSGSLYAPISKLPSTITSDWEMFD